MREIKPLSLEDQEYIIENMQIIDGSVVWTNSKYKRKKGYLCGCVDEKGYQKMVLPSGRNVRGHQVSYFLFMNTWPDKYVDHIDGNRLNNNPSNLRLVDDFGNSRNSRSTKNKTGYQGVSVSSGKNKNLYKSEIMIDGKRKYLGYFKTAEEAHEAYKLASIKLFKNYSPYTN